MSRTGCRRKGVGDIYDEKGQQWIVCSPCEVFLAKFMRQGNWLLSRPHFDREANVKARERRERAEAAVEGQGR